MAAHLIVGNQTLLSRELARELQQRVEAEEAECHFHVVVPQTPLDHYHSPVKGPTYTFAPAPEDDVQTVAEHRLELAIDEFSRLDAIVTGVIGDENPLAAVRHALSIDDYDEVIISTFPEGVSRWLTTDLPARLEDELSIPVTHIVSKTYDDSAERRRRHEELVRSLRESAD